MTSISLKEAESIAYKYCRPGELSLFLRKLIIDYDKRQMMNADKKSLIFTLQLLTYSITSLIFIFIGISAWFNFLAVITPGICILGGIIVIVYAIVSIVDKKPEGEKI